MCASKSRSILVLTVLLAVPFSPAWGDVTSDLVSHWMLDDGTGVVAVDSAGTNHGTLEGDAAWIEGYMGSAVVLDGQGDYIDCGNDASFNITDAITLAAWVRADADFAYPDWSGIIMRGGANIDTFALYYHRPSVRFGFKTTGTSPNWFATDNDSAAIFDGDWHHVAATYDGANKIVYLNGANIGETPSTGNIETSDGRTLLGAGRDQDPPTHFVAGRIDDARIYSRALTADDVKELIPPKLQAYDPSPADGAMAVQMALFRWTAGDTAVKHDIYLGTDPNLTEEDRIAAGYGDNLYFHPLGIEPGVQYYWRVDEIEVDGTVHTGNVWMFVSQARHAYYPTPADGATDASTTPDLTWLPGQVVIMHQVYFSDSLDAVTAGAPEADKGQVEDPNFAPGQLDPIATYYWRVDEIGVGGTAEVGPVWTFTTHLPVDDFESYTDEEGGEIFATWFDGFDDDMNGSLVAYEEAPFAEQTIVRNGAQSMPLAYDNTGGSYLSEVERSFSPAEDWTLNGADTLVLHVHGQTKNAVEPLYVTVADTSGRDATVMASDPNVVARPEWASWEIALSDLADANVNVSRIGSLVIGLGNPTAPAAGGTGRVFIDDIYVKRSAATE